MGAAPLSTRQSEPRPTWIPCAQGPLTQMNVVHWRTSAPDTTSKAHVHYVHYVHGCRMGGSTTGFGRWPTCVALSFTFHIHELASKLRGGQWNEVSLSRTLQNGARYRCGSHRRPLIPAVCMQGNRAARNWHTHPFLLVNVGTLPGSNLQRRNSIHRCSSLSPPRPLVFRRGSILTGSPHVSARCPQRWAKPTIACPRPAPLHWLLRRASNLLRVQSVVQLGRRSVGKATSG